jgi:hypothetical protein
MKSLSTIFLITQFLLTPMLNAANVQMAPVSMNSVSAPLAVGSALTQMGAGSMSLGSQSMSGGRLSLSAPLSGPAAPTVNASVNAAPAQVMQAANAILSALRPAAPAAMPQAQNATAIPQSIAPSASAETAIPGSQAQAQNNQTSTLLSLQNTAQPTKPGQTKETAASALFDGAAQKAEPKEWTLMVFLNGHNNLDDFGEVNIKQMEKVGSNDRVNIVVQWASLGKPTKRMLIQRSETGEVSSPVIEELPAVDMGSADQLSEFIAWVVERFPASHYMVDLWDHGAGWHLKKPGTRAKRGTVSPNDISWDDQTGSHITTEQLGVVMRKAKALIGRPIDILGFDACLMAMAEVMAQVADSVHYVAGSEQTEPGAGWPYEKFLTQWLAGEAHDAEALLKALTEQYVAAYGRGVAFSAVDLTKIPAFIEAVKKLGQELAKADESHFAEIVKAAQATQRYAYEDYGDFMDFVTKLANAAVSLVSAPVIAAVAAAYKDLVVANAAAPDLAASSGVSIWLPMSSQLWKEYGTRYLGLVWHQLTGWGDFVKRLAGHRQSSDDDWNKVQRAPAAA